MTRIYTFGLENGSNAQGSYLLVQVAHRDGKRALRAALKHASEHGKGWKLVHKAERRTGMAIPAGELMGQAGPFSFETEEA